MKNVVIYTGIPTRLQTTKQRQRTRRLSGQIHTEKVYTPDSRGNPISKP